MTIERFAPACFGFLMLFGWEFGVWWGEIPPYLLPGPVAVLDAFWSDPTGLLESLLATLAVTFTALAVSALLGAVLALATAASRLAQAAIQPWAVILQVTPIVAIAPLVIIWVNDPFISLVVCATIVAFFPVYANTVAGLAAAPHDLLDLFRLYGAGRARTLWLLRLPCALPYFLAGLRISGGLALVARWWRSSWPGRAGLPPAWRIGSWRRGFACRCRACSRPWYCFLSRALLSIWVLAWWRGSRCASAAKPEPET